MRRKNLILCITAIILAQAVYFVWLPFPKNFWKSLGSSGFASDFITNLIFFSAFAVILTASLNSVVGTGRPLSKKAIIISVAAVLCAELCIDFIQWNIVRVYQTWAQFSNDFFALLKAPLLVIIACRVLSIKSVNRKRFCAIIVPCFVIALAVLIIFDIRDMGILKHISDKYLPLSAEESASVSQHLNTFSGSDAVSSNLYFMYEIRNGIVDALVSIAAITALRLSVSPDNAKKKANSWGSGARLFSRIVVALVLSFALCWLKILILPHNALVRANGDSTQTYRDGFYFENNSVSLYRVQNRSGKKPVFCRSFLSLYYDNKKISTSYIDGDYSSVTYRKEGNLIYSDHNWDKINAGAAEAVACRDKLLAYVKDEAPRAIKFRDIKNHGYDEILLEMCRQFVSAGEMYRFEYVCPYLAKYSPEFIEPYLERYSNGDFSETEKEQMGDINPEYLINYAKDALQTVADRDP